MIESIYWHQLIAPGYGLIDNREGIKKYSAFRAFKTMVNLLEGAEDIALEHKNGVYKFTCKKATDNITVLWSQQEQTHSFEDAAVFSMYHEPIKPENVTIHESVIYVVSPLNSAKKEL
jgi:hypothetical protein